MPELSWTRTLLRYIPAYVVRRFHDLYRFYPRVSQNFVSIPHLLECRFIVLISPFRSFYLCLAYSEFSYNSISCTKMANETHFRDKQFVPTIRDKSIETFNKANVFQQGTVLCKRKKKTSFSSLAGRPPHFPPPPPHPTLLKKRFAGCYLVATLEKGGRRIYNEGR